MAMDDDGSYKHSQMTQKDMFKELAEQHGYHKMYINAVLHGWDLAIDDIHTYDRNTEVIISDAWKRKFVYDWDRPAWIPRNDYEKRHATIVQRKHDASTKAEAQKSKNKKKAKS